MQGGFSSLSNFADKSSYSGLLREPPEAAQCDQEFLIDVMNEARFHRASAPEADWGIRV
jgi:hypothetical protein